MALAKAVPDKKDGSANVEEPSFRQRNRPIHFPFIKDGLAGRNI